MREKNIYNGKKEGRERERERERKEGGEGKEKGRV